MRDEMDARIWVEHHEDFSRSIDALAARVRSVFSSLKPALARIHAFEWDAPWRRQGAGRA